MYDPEDDELVIRGWLNGHEVYREPVRFSMRGGCDM